MEQIIQAREARSPREEEGRNGLIETTEFECHDCGRTIAADIDLAVNGNHVIMCPCGHEHCRVVRNGRITSSRWDQRNGMQAASTQTAVYVTVTTATPTWYTGTSTTASAATTTSSTYASWTGS